MPSIKTDLDMLIHNVRLVLPDGVTRSGYLQSAEGQIVALGEGDVPRQHRKDYGSVIDGQGCLVLPGLIDLHGDMIERDVEPRPTAYFPTDLALFELDKRLAATGITTAYAAISFAEGRKMTYLRSEERARDTIHLINSLKDELLVDMRIHARFEITNHGAPRILHELLEHDHLDMISINDHTPGQGQYRDLEAYINKIAAWKGMPEEDFRVEVVERLENLEQHPPSWDVIHGVCEEAKCQNIVIASHDDDTVDKVDLVAGLGATISEFPVTLEAAQEAHKRGLYVLMGAPNAFRGKSTSADNLSALDVIQKGLVDMLASDYYPAAMLHTVFKLVNEDIMPLCEAVKLVSHNAARAAGLADRGSLELGKRADFVVVDDRPSTMPRVRATVAGGKLIFADGTLKLDPLDMVNAVATAVPVVNTKV
ncbi:MAG: alpha-D-ribose 1-methylphosphonate 5-triphosphate diphosphatase [Deinococcota bacterium]